MSKDWLPVPAPLTPQVQVAGQAREITSQGFFGCRWSRYCGIITLKLPSGWKTGRIVYYRHLLYTMNNPAAADPDPFPLFLNAPGVHLTYSEERFVHRV